MFNDRGIEFDSPGFLFPRLTIEGLWREVSKLRNFDTKCGRPLWKSAMQQSDVATAIDNTAW